MRLVRAFGLAAFAAGLYLGFLLGCGGAFAASADKGKAAFIQHGCWQCHGFGGQGGFAGKTLAPDPIAIEAPWTGPRHRCRAFRPANSSSSPCTVPIGGGLAMSLRRYMLACCRALSRKFVGTSTPSIC
jgi:hypothetical protein